MNTHKLLKIELPLTNGCLESWLEDCLKYGTIPDDFEEVAFTGLLREVIRARAESQPKPVVSREGFKQAWADVGGCTDPMWAYDFLASRTCVDLPSERDVIEFSLALRDGIYDRVSGPQSHTTESFGLMETKCANWIKHRTEDFLRSRIKAVSVKKDYAEMGESLMQRKLELRREQALADKLAKAVGFLNEALEGTLAHSYVGSNPYNVAREAVAEWKAARGEK